MTRLPFSILQEPQSTTSTAGQLGRVALRIGRIRHTISREGLATEASPSWFGDPVSNPTWSHVPTGVAPKWAFGTISPISGIFLRLLRNQIGRSGIQQSETRVAGSMQLFDR